MPMESLYYKGEPDEIYPFALLEYPVSALRLAGVLYDQLLQTDDRVLADFALFGVERWYLRPHSPRVFGYLRRDRRAYSEASDLVWEKPLVFRFEEISETPDWCAYRLAIRRTYEAFGYYEDEIPAEFDRAARRLIIDA